MTWPVPIGAAYHCTCTPDRETVRVEWVCETGRPETRARHGGFECEWIRLSDIPPKQKICVANEFRWFKGARHSGFDGEWIRLADIPPKREICIVSIPLACTCITDRETVRVEWVGETGRPETKGRGTTDSTVSDSGCLTYHQSRIYVSRVNSVGLFSGRYGNIYIYITLHAYTHHTHITHRLTTAFIIYYFIPT